MKPHNRAGLIFLGVCATVAILAFAFTKVGRTEEPSKKEAEIASSGCAANEAVVTYNGPTPATGVVTLTYGLSDTDAISNEHIPSSRPSCISVAVLEAAAVKSGERLDELEFQAAHDPNGSGANAKSYADFGSYEGEAPTIPPSEIRLGSAKFSYASGSLPARLDVRWVDRATLIADFQSQIDDLNRSEEQANADHSSEIAQGELRSNWVTTGGCPSPEGIKAVLEVAARGEPIRDTAMAHACFTIPVNTQVAVKQVVNAGTILQVLIDTDEGPELAWVHALPFQSRQQ